MVVMSLLKQKSNLSGMWTQAFQIENWLTDL